MLHGATKNLSCNVFPCVSVCFVCVFSCFRAGTKVSERKSNVRKTLPDCSNCKNMLAHLILAVFQPVMLRSLKSQGKSCRISEITIQEGFWEQPSSYSHALPRSLFRQSHGQTRRPRRLRPGNLAKRYQQMHIGLECSATVTIRRL